MSDLGGPIVVNSDRDPVGLSDCLGQRELGKSDNAQGHWGCPNSLSPIGETRNQC